MYKRKAIIDNDCMLLELEITEDRFPLLHCQVYKWSKELYKKYLSWFLEVQDILSEKNISEVFVNIPKHQNDTLKFAEMFGFEIKYETENTFIGVLEI